LEGIGQALVRARELGRQGRAEVAEGLERLNQRLSEVDRLKDELLSCQARIADVGARSGNLGRLRAN